MQLPIGKRGSRKDRLLFRPWKELKQQQDRKLRFFITRHLYPFSSYYRKLFDENKIDPYSIKTVEDLKNIPLTSKKNFFDVSGKDPRKRNLDFLLLPNEKRIRKYLPKKQLIKFLISIITKGKKRFTESLEKEYRPIMLTATTGTTKDPVPFLYTSYDIENLKIYGKRIIDIFDVKPSEKAINIFPYAPHLAFWQTFFAGLSSNVFILSTGGGKILGTDGNIRALLRVKPQFLIGVADYIYHILKAAREQDLNMSFLSKIALGASRVPKGFKRKLSKLLSEMGSHEAKIIGTYGFTEARCAWAECPTQIDISSGYHTYPDKEVFEIIDPETGEVKGEGEDGEIVYSNIDARGSCVLRYRTGDLVKGGILYVPCPHCGRTVPRISSDIVRASNIKNIQFSKIKGTLVNLNNLGHFLDDNEAVDEWYIEITKKNNDPYEVDELALFISLLKSVDKKTFIQKINEEIFTNSEVSFNKIDFITRNEMLQKTEVETSIKAKKIVDRRGIT